MGVRELKNTLSETLRAVGRGEPVRVTRRGRPLANLIPTGASTSDRLRQLVAAGRVAAPTQAPPTQAPGLASPSRLASELVLDERDVER